MAALLEVEGVSKSFGAVVAARDLEVSVSEGEIVGIIGANGAGKTTFVNLVTGYQRPSSGSIRFAGRDITALSPRRVTRLGIGRSFQVPQLFDSLTVRDNLMVALGLAEGRGAALLGLLGRDDRAERCHAILQRYRIADWADQAASTLPQGVRKLLDIAMAMAARPRLLLLDEPTSGISIEEKFELMAIVMTALAEDAVTVLFVEHDMEIVERHVTRVLAFWQGEIICDAPPARALDDPKVREFVIGQPVAVEARGGADADRA